MKTVAITSIPNEFRHKLVRYYTHRAETEERNAAGHSLVRDRVRKEIRAQLLRELADELLQIEIRELPLANPINVMFI